MKTARIIFWSTTVFIFLFEGVVPLLTSQTELAKESIRHLGYPDYFGVLLTFFKVVGAIALIIPKIPNRIKEWAYAGFAFDFISACVSNWAVDGFSGIVLFPLFVLAVLMASYIYYHKLNSIAYKAL